MHPALSAELCAHAREHIALLEHVHVAPEDLYEGPGLQAAVEAYRRWLKKLHKMLCKETEVRAPSLGVCWVWHLHKLDPVAYESDCTRAFGLVLGVPEGLSPFNWSDSDDEREREGEGDDNASELPTTEMVDVSADLVGCAKRQKSFLWQILSPEYQQPGLLARAEDRYVKLLQLAKLHPRSFIVPTYDMDLMWHTHLAFPDKYIADSMSIMGKVFDHDDTVNDRAEGSKLSISTAETRKLWKLVGKHGRRVRPDSSQ